MACLRQSSLLEGPRHGRCTNSHCRHTLTWAPTPATRTSEVVVVLGPAESDGGCSEGLGVLSPATHFSMAQKRLAWKKQTVKTTRLRCCQTGAHRDIKNTATESRMVPETARLCPEECWGHIFVPCLRCPERRQTRRHTRRLLPARQEADCEPVVWQKACRLCLRASSE